MNVIVIVVDILFVPCILLRLTIVGIYWGLGGLLIIRIVYIVR